MPLEYDNPASGCIRLYETGPQWHINSRHQTFGFKTTEPLLDPEGNPVLDEAGNPITIPYNPMITSAGDLYIRLLETRTVGYAAASVDETLAAKGVWAGISGGVSDCTIRLRKTGLGRLDLNNPAHWNSVRGDESNLWALVTRFKDPVS